MLIEPKEPVTAEPTFVECTGYRTRRNTSHVRVSTRINNGVVGENITGWVRTCGSIANSTCFDGCVVSSAATGASLTLDRLMVKDLSNVRPAVSVSRTTIV